MFKIKKKLHIIFTGGQSKVVNNNSNIEAEFSKVYFYDDRHPKIK